MIFLLVINGLKTMKKFSLFIVSGKEALSLNCLFL